MVEVIMQTPQAQTNNLALPAERVDQAPALAGFFGFFSGLWGALRIVFGATCQSFLAYRRYEHLKKKGIPHHAALTKALDTGTA
jgi:hypothetical protein